MSQPSLALLSRLWLSEPDARTLVVAREAGLPGGGDPADLAAAWTDLFLLNVYPYGTAFTDISGELNGPAAAAASRRYEAAGYRPQELSGVGAADHVGLCLGFFAHLEAGGREDLEFLAWTLDWLPVCALAVERQPSADPFYRNIAAATREALLSFTSARASARACAAEDLAPVLEIGPDTEDELDLSRVVRFLLAPAACGFFLSRSRLGALALEAGLRLPFGSRFDVARALFEAAGECGRVEPVLEALSCEAEAWDAAYAALARAHRSWEIRAGVWRERIGATRERLAQMRRIVAAHGITVRAGVASLPAKPRGLPAFVKILSASARGRESADREAPMYFKQFYLGCLAQASYMIGSKGEAAVVDPRRDVETYLEEAEREKLTIRHVIETHLHADFVSGHRELAALTGAKIYFGAKAQAGFDCVAVSEGDEIVLGDVTLHFLETPGHTPESLSVLVIDRAKSDTPEAVLTGDTLFIGDVGRPDLLGAKMSARELAGMLYDSLHEKLLKLPDSVAVYPAHGAGSLCGRNISSETSSTIGQQRRFNYALQPMAREEFIAMMTTDLPEAPAYFSRDVRLNREGPGNLSELPEPPALAPAAVDAMLRSGAVLLDTRAAAQYGTGHVPGSLNIGLGGQFASWAGSLIPAETPIVLVTEDEDHVAQARTRLARVGLEKVAGYLAGGILAWHESGRRLAATEQISVDELRHRLVAGEIAQLVDVRRPGEWQAGHIAQARHLPLDQLSARAGQLERGKPVTAICAGGYRSSMATSLLEQLGFTRITNVVGGMTAWNVAPR